MLLAGALAGCSSHADKPRVLPTLAPTSASPAPSPSPVPKPTGIEAATPQGAAAFARYWYAQITEAYKRRDPELIRRLSAPSCRPCSRFVDSIAAVRDEGQRVSGVVYTITLAEAPAISGPYVRVDVIYNVPEALRFDRAGKVVEREAAATGRQVELTLVRRGTTWLVKDSRSV